MRKVSSREVKSTHFFKMDVTPLLTLSQYQNDLINGLIHNGTELPLRWLRIYFHRKLPYCKTVEAYLKCMLERGNAYFNHLRWCLTEGDGWLSSSDQPDPIFPHIADQLRDKRLTEFFRWVIVEDKVDHPVVLLRGEVWHASERRCREEADKLIYLISVNETLISVMVETCCPCYITRHGMDIGAKCNCRN